jgi:hypothetical protein
MAVAEAESRNRISYSRGVAVVGIVVPNHATIITVRFVSA